jgi:hypothetical protein
VRIVLIHALKLSIAPIETAFDRLWPEAERVNLLDDSLSVDRARDGGLTDAMRRRFLTLGDYARGIGADGVLFTCSAFGPAIEAVAEALGPIPVLKPNEAMIAEAVAAGGKVGLVASFAPTLESMVDEFPSGLTVRTALAEGALDALAAGDGETHDRLAAAAALTLADCPVIALAQFSLARAAERVAAATGKRVLTTPDCAVAALRQRLGVR